MFEIDVIFYLFIFLTSVLAGKENPGLTQLIFKYSLVEKPNYACQDSEMIVFDNAAIVTGPIENM